MNCNTNEVIGIILCKILHKSDTTWAVSTPHCSVLFDNHSTVRNPRSGNSRKRSLVDRGTINLTVHFGNRKQKVCFRNLRVRWHIHLYRRSLHVVQRFRKDIVLRYQVLSIEGQRVIEITDSCATVIGNQQLPFCTLCRDRNIHLLSCRRYQTMILGTGITCITDYSDEKKEL